MPKLLSRSKHEELESNSTLKIRNQKERRAENARNGALQELWQVTKFLQPIKMLPAFSPFTSV